MREPDLKAEPRAKAGLFAAPFGGRLPAYEGCAPPSATASPGLEATMAGIIPICGCRQEGVYTPDAGRTWLCAECLRAEKSNPPGCASLRGVAGVVAVDYIRAGCFVSLQANKLAPAVSLQAYT